MRLCGNLCRLIAKFMHFKWTYLLPTHTRGDFYKHYEQTVSAMCILRPPFPSRGVAVNDYDQEVMVCRLWQKKIARVVLGLRDNRDSDVGAINCVRTSSSFSSVHVECIKRSIIIAPSTIKWTTEWVSLLERMEWLNVRIMHRQRAF